MAKLKTRQEVSQERREAILEEALVMFLKDGYQATSINKLVARVGGSKDTIYSYFKNKEGLFRAIIDSVINDLTPLIESLELEHKSLREGLLIAGEDLLTILSTERAFTMRRLVFSEATRRPELGALFYDHVVKPHYKNLAKFFSVHQKKGELINIDPEHLAQYFWAMLIHYVLVMRDCNVAEKQTKEEIHQQAIRVSDDFITAFSTKHET